ncbi:MAG: NAD(P)-binding domain-containing protein [Gemmatimonadales bacterium]
MGVSAFDADLLVLGGGPTGIAALLHASLAGLSAVGVEAGLAPLDAVHHYMEGLVLASHAREFEVAHVPLDCSNPREVTREELLHYYARLLNLGRIRLLCGCRCVAIRCEPDHVCAVVQDGGRQRLLRARHILVTAWHERAAVPPEVLNAGVPCVHNPRNGLELANRRVVILGGGMSGFEHALSLMMQGQAITLLSRSGPKVFHRGEGFRKLVRDTNSTVVFGVSRIWSLPGLVGYEAEPANGTVECDLILIKLGNRPAAGVLDLLFDAGVLTAEERSAAARSRGVADLLRDAPGLPLDVALNQAIEGWPDFWDLLFHGRKGVRLAGGMLHTGEARAGTMLSIHSARLAVRSVVGDAVPAGFVRPLAGALIAWAFEELRAPSSHWSEPAHLGFVSKIRPLRLGGGPENASGDLRNAPDIEAAVLALSSGEPSCADLMNWASQSGYEEQSLVLALDKLWRNGTLSWLPPR